MVVKSKIYSFIVNAEYVHKMIIIIDCLFLSILANVCFKLGCVKYYTKIFHLYFIIILRDCDYGYEWFYLILINVGFKLGISRVLQ